MDAYSRKKIIDEFTDRPVSRQRKWQLRHPEKNRALVKRWRTSPKGREKNNAAQRRYYLRTKATPKEEQIDA